MVSHGCKTSISSSLSATGHGGDFYGVDTWMLYNSSEDIGVIYLANGNPAFFGLLPFGGLFLYKMILYLLFTKEGTFRGEMQHDFKVSSNPFFIRTLMVPQPMLG